MGPTLVHTRKDVETFSYFGSTLTGLEPDLRNIRFLGSDREYAVEKGMSNHLPIATWLACKRHVEDDCRRKLRSLGILHDISVRHIWKRLDPGKRVNGRREP